MKEVITMDIKDVLEKVAKEARSNKHGFKTTDKLEAIEELLRETNSDFHIVHKTPHTWIFGKKEPEVGENALLVSTHADIVNSIKNPYSTLDEETKYFKGTYDNLGTNGVCASLMVNEELPDNVYFAFNDEEETGRCLGAGDALWYINKKTKREPIVLALDVTDEGYENNRLFTVEGLHGVNEFSRKKMLEIFMNTEGEEQSFEVVKLKKHDDNSFLPESYQNKTLTIFDESVFYARNNCNSCSLCLPGEGEMHGDEGFYVKEGVMRGYEIALLLNIYAFTKTYPNRIEELKVKKDEFVRKAKETEFRKEEPIRYFSYEGTSSGISRPYTSNYQSSFEEGIRLSREYREKLYDDYLDMESYNESFGLYDEDEDYENFIFMQAIDDAYELAQGYAEDELEVYIQDIVAMYGIENNEKNREAFEQIFEDVQAMKRDYNEEDENLYNVDMD